MEFNEKNDKVIGVIDQKRGIEDAVIKILAVQKSHENPVVPSVIELCNIFKPTGHIFAPGLFKNEQNNLGDLVELVVEEIDSEKVKEGYANYRMVCNSIKTRTKSLEITDFFVKDNYIDLRNIGIKNTDYQGDFYGVTNEFVLDKLNIKNNSIKPAKGKSIRLWKKTDCKIIEYQQNSLIIQVPDKQGLIVDCMNDDQLFIWFKEKLQIINKSAVNELNTRTNWKTEIPKIFNESDDDTSVLERIRLNRIELNFHNYDLLVSDIKELAETSNTLREVYQSCIEQQKEELRKEYLTDIEEFKSKNESDKQKLELQLINFNNQIESKKGQLINLNEELNLCNSKIDQINVNKDRILSDFSIIQEVLNTKVSKGESKEYLDSFVIEIIDKQEYAQAITSTDKLIARCKYFLNNYNLNPKIGRRLLKLIASYNGIFISDISIAVAIAEATGNAKYIIQQVEPDWLHFKDFWDNGLGALWVSSHQNPKQFHFLILEDINLASPECYARPLLDCMNGIRKHIPYGKTSYPKNLKVFATSISSDEPKIGLPLFEQTFKDWGAFGFSDEYNLSEKSVSVHSFIEGFFDVESMDLFHPDELEIKLNSQIHKKEFTCLFQTVE